MCGIAAVLSYKEKEQRLSNEIKAQIKRLLLCEMLATMEERGKDATGIALLWENKTLAVVKQPVMSSFFVRNDGKWQEEYNNKNDKKATFSWLAKAWIEMSKQSKLTQALGHVRAGTVGSEYNSNNNHPIIICDGLNELTGKPVAVDKATIVGIHNGCIKNHEDLFKTKKFNRIAEVDSEIIFQLINAYNDNLTLDNLAQTYDELDGSFAVVAFNPQNPSKVACMKTYERPMEVGFFPTLGMLAVVSEKKFLENACHTYGKWRVRECLTEVFPFIGSPKWYTAVTSGVFVLDLDTEVDEKTTVEELVKIRSVTKTTTSCAKTDTRAAYSTTNAYRHHSAYEDLWDGNYNNYDASPADASGASNTSDSVAKTQGTSTTEEKSSNEVNVVVKEMLKQETPESTVEAEQEALNSQEDYAVFELSIDPTETEGSTESGQDIETEDRINYGNIDFYSEDFPFTWEQALEVGEKLLFEDEELAQRTLLGRVTDESAKEALEIEGVYASNENQAMQTIVALSTVIFPEGFAAGLFTGYQQAYEDLGDEEDQAVTSLREDIEVLKQDLAIEKEKSRQAIKQLASAMRRLKKNEDKKKKDVEQTSKRKDETPQQKKVSELN